MTTVNEQEIAALERQIHSSVRRALAGFLRIGEAVSVLKGKGLSFEEIASKVKEYPKVLEGYTALYARMSDLQSNCHMPYEQALDHLVFEGWVSRLIDPDYIAEAV